MAKFLFTVWPFPGHVHPNVAIARALCERGHVAAFYTGASVRTSLEADALGCFPFEQVDETRVDAIVKELDALSLQWWQVARRKALLREWLLETIEPQVRDLDTVFSAWKPDVVVCDPALWAPLLVLRETKRVPLAIMSYVAACMLPGPEGPILGLPLPKAYGPGGRLGRRVLRTVATRAGAEFRRAADAIRARHGLSPIGTTVTAFAGQVDLYLVPSTPAFDRDRKDLPPSVHYVGPCRYDNRSSSKTAAWLVDLPRDRPLVYVTEGTMHSKSAALLRATLQGLASAPATVIATTGRHRDPGSLGLGTIPANARVEQWVSHTDLLPRADVVVTTGGTGTVLATLWAGVPLVIVPMAWDQPENAWRVAEAGAGIRLAPRECTPEKLRRAVERVLTDRSFRENARRLATGFRGYGGAIQAASLLEDLATGASPRGGPPTLAAVVTDGYGQPTAARAVAPSGSQRARHAIVQHGGN
jgi:MGT family glycosyltransferase